MRRAYRPGDFVEYKCERYRITAITPTGEIALEWEKAPGVWVPQFGLYTPEMLASLEHEIAEESPAARTEAMSERELARLLFDTDPRIQERARTLSGERRCAEFYGRAWEDEAAIRADCESRAAAILRRRRIHQTG